MSQVNPNERLEQLEGQIKDEVERRFSDMISQYRKHAQRVLTAEEMEAFTDHLGEIMEKPETNLSPETSEVFNKLGQDPQARAIFDRLIKIIGLRGMTKGAAAKQLQPQVVAKVPEVLTADRLREKLVETAGDLIQIAPNPEQWVGWIIFWLEALDREAHEAVKEMEFGRVLERLLDMVINRIENEQW